MASAVSFVARSRKFIVALIGVLAMYLSHQFVNEVWLTSAIAALDALAVYIVPNDQQ